MLQRYEWEDLLIVAQRDGHIDNGALMVGLKLARAINWAPRQGRSEPGLYWKNDEAFKDVGLGRSTFYSHRKTLVDLGFLSSVKGNLVPRLPKSLPKTKASTAGPEESLGQTSESLGQQPFTVDTFTVDTFTVDTFSEEVLSVDRAAADASADKLGDKIHQPPSLTLIHLAPESFSSNLEKADLDSSRESLRGTVESVEAEYAALMTDWYAEHPEVETFVPQPSSATVAYAEMMAGVGPETKRQSLRAPYEAAQGQPETARQAM